MKNVRKLFTLIFVAILACTFSFTTVLAADAPSSITVKRAEVLRDLITNHEYGYTVFTTNEGKSIYCLDNLKKAMITGQTGYDNGEADDGILYILQKGYPNVQKVDGMTWTNVAARDFYITQAAVWLYMEETGQGSNKLSDEFKNATTTDVYKLLPRIKTLVANAKKYKDNQVKPTVSVNVNGEVLALTSDNKYYESQPISVKLTGASNYSVIFNGGTANTVITDASGKANTTFKANETFKVRIPANELTKKTDINIKVTANGIKEVAKVYKPTDDQYQRVVGLYEENMQASTTLKLAASPETTSIEVEVPNTSANILMISIIMGMLIIIGGVGLIAYRSKKIHQK